MVDEDLRKEFIDDQNLEGEERDREWKKEALDRLTEADIELRREWYEDIREGEEVNFEVEALPFTHLGCA